MAISETARLIASLELKDLFTKSVNDATKSLGKLDKSIDGTQGRAYKAGTQIGVGIKRGVLIAVGAASGLTALFVQIAREGQHAADVQSIYANAIAKSGKITADYVTKLNAQSLALSNLTGMDDEQIKSEQTRLIQMKLSGAQILTLLPLILDAAKSTGRDLDSVTLAVGRAVQGSATSLGRLGIIVQKGGKSAALAALEQKKALVGVEIAQAKANGTFEKGTKKTLEGRKATLDAAIAQQKYKDSLNKTAGGFDTVVNALKVFEGTNAALSGSIDVKLKTFGERLQDIREEAGQKLLPVLTRIIDSVTRTLLPAFQKFIDAILPSVISGLNDFADALDSGDVAKRLTGVFDTIKAAAPIIEKSAQATFTIVKAAVDLFTSLPEGIQSIAVGAFAINKLTGGLVTNIGGALIDLVGKSRGSSPANPVFVSDVAGDLTGGKGPAGKFGGILQNISLAALIPVVAVAVSETLKTVFPGNPVTGPQPILNGPLPSKPIIDLGSLLGSLHLPFFGGPSSPPVKVTLVDHAGSPLLDRGGRESGVRAPIFLPGDTRSEGRATGPASVQSVLTRAISLLMAQGGLQKAFILSLHGEFRDAFKLLAKANSAQQIKDAIKAINKITFDKGIGGSGGAAATEKTLRGLLIKFPSLASILVPEIRKVHAKMLGRQFEEGEFRKFDKIFKSNEDSKHKIADLQKIAKAVGARDDANGKRLQARVDALKAATIAQAAATRKTIAANDPRIYLTIPVENRVVVNARQVQATAAIFSRVFGGTPTGTRAPRGG
jgi:hypothetical protein